MADELSADKRTIGLVARSLEEMPEDTQRLYWGMIWHCVDDFEKRRDAAN
jgi:hypothetical protein